MKKIRVVLVDDSPVALFVLKKLLARSDHIDVVGTASDGRQALALIPMADPDVVCTDLHMPEMDGLELTRRLMEEFPKPIMVLSAVDGNAERTFQVLQAGALEFVEKPAGLAEPELKDKAKEIIDKISILAGVKVFRKRRQAGLAGLPTVLSPLPGFAPAMGIGQVLGQTLATPAVIGIGASTGGPTAFSEILREIPADYPVPIVAVQHMAAGFMSAFVHHLNGFSRIEAKLAEEGEKIRPGRLYFAPEDYHLEVERSGCLRLSGAPPLEGHRPSVGVLLASLGRHFAAESWGVLLTGMGKDGAAALKTIRNTGGFTVAQEEASCAVYGMPGEAEKLGAACRFMAPRAIGKLLAGLARR
ncbi:chemotaxis-specific protein-glutamate methyltransferase CheB [Heliobacterium gestii]|uniref:Protein-glutamate methylesterase/protein-glutamine glutaminase n=1 Tax=Heliomicrobium gestii TaxID=2699 RepID=A0A845LCQ0_HELGE|nr:chemotaxis-specific protein-glutamate methyltransferase CheB [Heliomicrobium gestii]MBM7867483.1 two-component system chemotaxis response regulator CheB [Heliomicrobium gestii]MZP43968.1 chemotaxis-specific protein-glutamate methyltransferase CheB [Heliomicrobium gestii]